MRRLFLAGLLASVSIAQQRSMSIYWVDVEGGAATLLVTPLGESVLFDAGDDTDRDASRIFAVASKHAGLKRIDHLVVSHWHPDHYGGAARLMQRIPVDRIYNRPIPPSIPEDPDPKRFPRMIADFRKAMGDRGSTIGAGFLLPLKGSTVAIRCVAGDRKVAVTKAKANPDCSQMVPAEPDKTDNANSLAFTIAYSKFSMFTGGDLTKDVEQKLVCPANLVGPVTLYQTDAHGMDVGSDPTFLRGLKPRVVVVNNGPRKGAEPATMKTLFSVPSIEAVWQMHENLRNDGGRNTDAILIANREEYCSARFIKAVVAPGGSFTIAAGDASPRRYQAH